MKVVKTTKFIKTIALSALLLSMLTSCLLYEVMMEEDGDLASVSVPTSSEIMSLINSEPDSEPDSDPDSVFDPDQSWAIYLYLCGSDLESDGGYASDDLKEIMSVSLPDNVTVVIQTGGAKRWHSNLVDANYTQRFVYDSDGMRLVEELPLANMGEADTLADFLQFANQNYPADNVMLNFWNHGAGSVYGVCFDEVYDEDALTIDEYYYALSEVFPINSEDPPLQIVTFDACLMATVDVANSLVGLSDYLVASQEYAPGEGLYYTGFLEQLAYNPGMSPEDLSIAICKTYIEECSNLWISGEVTISSVNISKVPDLIVAYDNYGKEVFSDMLDNPNSYTRFSSAAETVENYGGNTESDGFYNMIDLGHLARKTRDQYDSAEAVLNALEQCVVYEDNGEYREEATGLSCFYSFDHYISEIYQYETIAASPAFSYLYRYTVADDLDETGLDYISDLGYDYESEQEIPHLTTVLDMGWENHPLYLDDDGFAVLDLGPEAYDILDEVLFRLYYYSDDENIIVDLGRDNDIIIDWDNGIFIDNFRGVWGSIDGALCYLDLSYVGEDYNTYSVPVMINGEKYSMSVIYDFIDEEWTILGSRPYSSSGGASKELYQLQVGDIIEPIHYATTLEDNLENILEITVGSITVDENTSFYETDLDDGNFTYTFEMHDSSGNVVDSASATFIMEDGTIYSTLN